MAPAGSMALVGSPDAGELFADGTLWTDATGWIEDMAVEDQTIVDVIKELKDALAVLGVQWSEVTWQAPDGSLWRDGTKLTGQ